MTQGPSARQQRIAAFTMAVFAIACTCVAARLAGTSGTGAVASASVNLVLGVALSAALLSFVSAVVLLQRAAGLEGGARAGAWLWGAVVLAGAVALAVGLMSLAR